LRTNKKKGEKEKLTCFSAANYGKFNFLSKFCNKKITISLRRKIKTKFQQILERNSQQKYKLQSKFHFHQIENLFILKVWD